MALTEQRKLFVQKHLKLRYKNVTQAAINAGYSQKSAQSQSSLNLMDPNVLEYLNEQKQQLEQGLDKNLFLML